MTRTKKVDDLLKAALRLVNAFSDGEEPDSQKLSDTRSALNDILDDLEKRGVRFFRRKWRSRVFEKSSVILEDELFYRCIKQHTSPDVSIWESDKVYSKEDLVFPTEYNGYYYKNISEDDAKSDVSEPVFPINQDDTVSDNDVTWQAVPDTRPGIGKNWKSVWIISDTETEGVDYTQNTEFKRSGDFELLSDEMSIERAYVRFGGSDDPVVILRTADYSNIPTKTNEGYPEDLYLEDLGVDSVLCHLTPSPSQLGSEGHILHYLAALRGETQVGSQNIDMPDYWFRALKYILASDIGPEHGVKMQRQVYFDNKANTLVQDAMKIDKPRATARRRIKSAY